MSEPYLFAISGLKNTGKTTMVTSIIPCLLKMGYKVATIKHDGHDFQADVPGTDSYKHAQAGAYGTAVFSDSKYMLVKQQNHVSEKELAQLFPEADIILLEGFKYSSYPKIEIVRSAISDRPVCREDSLLAVATDVPFEQRTEGGSTECGLKDVAVFEIDAYQEIAEFIEGRYLDWKKSVQ